jgi:hypothetical protein
VSPIPKKDPPNRITLLVPKRSTTPPTKGPTRLWIIIKSEKAPAARDRLQPNSFKSATKKTENEYQAPYVRERVTKLTPTMTQPDEDAFFSFIKFIIAYLKEKFNKNVKKMVEIVRQNGLS